MSSLYLSRLKLQGPLINPPNGTTPMSEFILLGFPSLGQLSHTLLCALLSIAYTGTLASNLCILWDVLQDPHLQHLPMYILLGNFSWLEICYVTATVPWMLSDLVSPGIPVSFQACFMQFYFTFSMGATECFFLLAMAFDRYLAICHPLHYRVLMCPKRCWALVASCWLSGFLWFIVPVALISQLLVTFTVPPQGLTSPDCQARYVIYDQSEETGL
ncbi:olfactory receptor 11G2-like [Gopherus flavomarginatus]|uniref:olfactory receptor 11G2-like n=1 Tax=Gopherus flavomarginatus TaxID=286002 RepID=UPI0021CBDE0C|nr:olfactory receptor 11G2-like [Gopherus flavomarginatus]